MPPLPLVWSSPTLFSQYCCVSKPSLGRSGSWCCPELDLLPLFFIALTSIHMNKSLYHCRIRDKLQKKERTFSCQVVHQCNVFLYSLGNPCKFAAFEKEKLQVQQCQSVWCQFGAGQLDLLLRKWFAPEDGLNMSWLSGSACLTPSRNWKQIFTPQQLAAAKEPAPPEDKMMNNIGFVILFLTGFSCRKETTKAIWETQPPVCLGPISVTIWKMSKCFCPDLWYCILSTNGSM